VRKRLHEIMARSYLIEAGSENPKKALAKAKYPRTMCKNRRLSRERNVETTP